MHSQAQLLAVLRLILLAFVSVCLYTTTAGAAEKIDETWGSRLRTNSKTFSDAESFRRSNKMGVQTTVLGGTGLLGFSLNFNITEDFEFSFGMGVSRGYRSFNGYVKRSLGSGAFSAYVVGGYSRWFNDGAEDGVKNTTPGILAKKFLSARERHTGDFAENLIYPGVGVQFLNLSGEWAGAGLFAEVLMLIDIEDFVAGPTAGLGANYYF